jgi:amidase
MSINSFSSATELLEQLRTRQLSAVELLECYIDRIERYDDTINAVVT